MSAIQVNQLKRKLEELYSDKIDLSDVNEQDKDNCFLSRAYAAYTLQILSNISEDVAAESITDSYNDNGVDAVFYDSKSNELWIVQSKWIKKGCGEPESGEISKFVNGIRDLMELNFERFNEKFQIKKEVIENALCDSKIRIKLVLTYTGADVFSEYNSRLINDLLEEVNEASEVMDFSRFTLKQAIQSLVNLLDGNPITRDILIKNWERIDNPYKAVLGIIDGSTLAQLWIDNRTRLFSDNIREFIGNTSVNADIKKTALEEPEKFLYYNNGVTILCNEVDKHVAGGTDHAASNFHIENMKIVNGAQTVGSLGEAYGINPESVSKTNVFVKIISLQGSTENFGNEVTRKTNTQNRIEKRDFVSLDPQHERLKTDFALDNIFYQIKRTDSVPVDFENICNVEDLITAVACSMDNVDFSITTKREVGKLWEDISSDQYKSIINDRLTATKAWRCIRIMRQLSLYIKDKEKSTTARKKSCYIHSNRFILHLLLTQIDQQLLNDPNCDFNDFFNNELVNRIDFYETKVFSIVERDYSSSLIHQIFRNYTKSRDIKEKVITE